MLSYLLYCFRIRVTQGDSGVNSASNAIDSEITALNNQIIDIEKESVVDWLPESVRSDSSRSEKALHFIYGEMTQNKGMTLKQAIKEYERRNFLS